MPQPSSIHHLDDHLLDTVFDPGSNARGRVYADEDRVRLLSSEPGVLDAVCRGSGQSSYVVRIRWRRSDSHTEIDDTCTCPLGGGCKHCVAVILTARRQAGGGSTPEGASGVAADWRRELAELTTTEDDDEVGEPSGL
ncbi:MAG TPA: SWIM zinc finger family protein, partial [Acidimicrobiales bacterium]